MDRDEIRKLEAGRELDALVAEKIMGAVKMDSFDPSGRKMFYWKPDSNPSRHSAPDYSTDISAAWLVLEKILSKTEYHVAMNSFISYWSVNFYYTNSGIFGYGETAPLAICRAALLAVQP